MKCYKLQLIRNFVVPGNNVVPRRRLCTWDKVSLYALNQLTANAVSTWFSLTEIKNKIQALVTMSDIAIDAVNHVHDAMAKICLSRLTIVGIVNKTYVHSYGGDRHVVYELNTNNSAVITLTEALDDEISYRGYLSGAVLGRTNLVYTAIYYMWREEHDEEQNNTTCNATPHHTNDLNSTYIRRQQRALRELELS